MTRWRTADGTPIVRVGATLDESGRCRMCRERACYGVHYAPQGSAELETLHRALRYPSSSPRGAARGGLSSRGSLSFPRDEAELRVRWRDHPDELVVVRSGAAGRMCAELYATTMIDGLETAGFLYASVLGPACEILAAGGPGERAQRTSGSCQIDPFEIVAEERAMKSSGSDLYNVGLWHCHPAPDGDARPSPADLTAWRRGFADLEEREGSSRARYVGLILTLRDYVGADWTDPEIHGFVIHRDPITREVICETARVKED